MCVVILCQADSRHSRISKSSGSGSARAAARIGGRGDCDGEDGGGYDRCPLRRRTARAARAQVLPCRCVRWAHCRRTKSNAQTRTCPPRPGKRSGGGALPRALLLPACSPATASATQPQGRGWLKPTPHSCASRSHTRTYPGISVCACFHTMDEETSEEQIIVDQVNARARLGPSCRPCRVPPSASRSLPPSLNPESTPPCPSL